MKIKEYITKRGVTELPHSLTQPVVLPAKLFEDYGHLAKFTGMNADRSVVVALYPDRDLFVALENKPQRKILGRISLDCPGLA